MATLAGIQKQIADLEKQAEAIRKADAVTAATKAKELIARHNLTAEDLGLTTQAAPTAQPAKSAKPAAVKQAAVKPKAAGRPAGVAKYQDPKTLKTWTGTGKPPGWIAGAKNRDKFLISANSATPVAPAVEKAPALGAVVTVQATKAPRAKAAPVAKPASPEVAVSKAKAPKAPKASKAAQEAVPVAPVKKAAIRKAAAKKVSDVAAVIETANDTVAVAPTQTAGD